MAEFFDVLRGDFQLPDPQAQLDEELKRQAEATGVPVMDVAADLNMPGIEAESESQKRDLQRFGFVQRNDGKFYDPNRNIAVNREARYQMMLANDKQRREQIANSVLFKVGDTLADTGRMFLSPLFWLKGEDTTKYDPSERLKTGYRNQFDALQELRTVNMEKFLTSRQQRAQAMSAYDVQRSQLSLSALSPEEKGLRAFVTERPEYATAYRQGGDERKRVREIYRAEVTGDMTMFNNRYVTNDNLNRAYGRADKFEKGVSGYKEALGAYESLKAVASAGGSGIGDIAVITGFMKLIDPGSVVREGEFANVAGVAGLGAQLQIMLNKISNADDPSRIVNDAMIDEIMRISGELVKRYEDHYEGVYNRYSDQLKAVGFSSDSDIKSLLGEKYKLERFKSPSDSSNPVIDTDDTPDDDLDALMTGEVKPASLTYDPSQTRQLSFEL